MKLKFQLGTFLSMRYTKKAVTPISTEKGNRYCDHRDQSLEL